MSGTWGLREGVTAALHLVALFGFAFAQPLFGLLSQHPDYFVLHGSSTLELVAFACIPSLLAPLGVAAVVSAVGVILPRAGRWMLRVVVAFAIAAFALPALRAALPAAAGDARVALPIAAVAGLAGTLAYVRIPPVGMFLSWLSPVGLVFPALFLFFSPMAELLAPPAAPPPRGPAIRGDVPVVLLILDELPLASLLDGRDEIDAELFPNLAGLARRSHWFRNATTGAAYTTTAVPAILTGTLSEKRKLTTYAAQPESLFTLLSGGRGMTVFETSTDLCPPSLCADEMIPERFATRMKNLLWDSGVVGLHILLPSDLARSLPTVNGAWKGFGRKPRRYGAVETDRFLPSGEPSPHPEWARIESRAHGGQRRLSRLLHRLHEGRESSLYFFHLNLPHIPWIYFQDGTEYSPAPFWPHGVDERRWGEDEWEVIQGQQRHLLQVGYVDVLVGLLLDELEEVGLFDRALLIVVSDHGASFRPGDHAREITDTNYGDILPIPLLIKRPGQRRGEIHDENAETIDLVPTIADVLGIEIPWAVEGRSLFDAAAPARASKRAMRTSFLDQVKNRWVFEPLRHTPEEVERARRESTALRRARFGSGWEGVLEIGPHPELLGRRFDELAVGEPAAGLEASIFEIEAFSAVSVGTEDVLPANVHGQFEGGAPARDAWLAVAVGGIVRAITRPFDGPDGSIGFSALVPPSAFQPGDNPLSLGIVSPGGGSPSLRPVRLR